MFMEVLCCVLMLACCVVLYIQIRLEDKLYYGAIYEAERIRYEKACKEETMTRKEAIKILDEQHLTWTLKKDEGYCMEVNEAIDMAIEALQDTRNCILTLFGDCSYNETGCSDCEIKQTIYKALSVDLVRCGECIYRDCCSELGDEIDADDYCSFGERRSDE